MNIRYQEDVAPIASELVESLLVLSERVFGSVEAEHSRWRLVSMPALTAFTAWQDGRMVGFKIGYAATARRYYSWLGGVDPDVRRSGIALELMARQHQWVEAAGFELIETEVQQHNHAMQQLNERSGFLPAGIRFDQDVPRIIYRKRLVGMAGG